MASVRMKFSFNGYRYPGGPKWPAFNEVLSDITDEEAAKLVAAGHAVYLEDEPAPLTAGFNALNQWTNGYDPALDPANKQDDVDDDLDLEDDEDEEEAGGLKRPYTNAKKEEWVAYALQRAKETGDDPDVIQRMSRVDLISKYGASI